MNLSGNEDRKVFSDKEPQCKDNSAFGKHCICIKAVLIWVNNIGEVVWQSVYEG